MCGTNSAQTADEAQQQAETAQLQQEQQQAYGENQSILSKLTAAYAPIVAAGPSQEGYSAAEKTNLNTQATEGTASGYAAAQKDMAENQAAQGGGNSSLPSGAATAEQGDLASKALNQEGNLKNQILTNDYTQGNENYKSATSGLLGVAAENNPVGYANAETASGSAASNTANQIAQNSNSLWNSVISGITSVGSSALNYFSGGGSDGGSSTSSSGAGDGSWSEF